MEEANTSTWREKLGDTYRLVVRHDETFSELGSYRFTLMHIYLYLLGALLVLLTLTFLLFFFTPLKTLVPGYGLIEDQSAFIQLKADYEELEDQVEAQQLYVNSLRRMLTDDPEQIQEVIAVDSATEEVDTDGQVIKEDSLFRKKIENESELLELRDDLISNLSLTSQRNLDQIHFVPPVKGEITAPFMPENLHYGVDIMAPSNTPILATLDGMVITSDWTLETGYTLGILHDNNLVSFYKHNSANLKQTGERVNAGEAVAIIGNSGTLTTGPHLHFELWLGDKAIDPAEYLIFN